MRLQDENFVTLQSITALVRYVFLLDNFSTMFRVFLGDLLRSAV